METFIKVFAKPMTLWLFCSLVGWLINPVTYGLVFGLTVGVGISILITFLI